MSPRAELMPDGAAFDTTALFPRGVSVLARPVEGKLDGLFPEELVLVARAVPKRQQEFATGRRLARQLLSALGWPDFPLLSDSDRAPIWPAGIVGSISHSHGLCVVAAAKRGSVDGLGVDVEEANAVRPEIWRRVLLADEQSWLRAQPSADQLHLAAVFFSAKEAVYKAQFPSTRARLGFHDVQVTLDAERSEFRARTPGFSRPLAGTFAIAEPWVLTGLALTREDLPT